GEKMSKSLGNLVLVSKLRAAGVEPVAIRAVLLSQHYRTDWFWTDELLAGAQQRVATWRKALESASMQDAQQVIAGIREHMANDLDAPSALKAIDQWATQPASSQGEGATALRDGINALLGLKL
ncbi:MAG: cysteine--1-D-myo-inosityl 2-amino-2-deoxy-alpha-D-glucopyranoside ligase, partial [Glutamicibacter arilaitensis]